MATAKQKYPVIEMGGAEFIGIPKSEHEGVLKDIQKEGHIDKLCEESGLSMQGFLESKGFDTGQFHWIRYYPMPEEIYPGDETKRLEGYLRLMESFERRFLSNTDRGDQLPATGKYIKKRLNDLAHAEEELAQEKERVGYQEKFDAYDVLVKQENGKPGSVDKQEMAAARREYHNAEQAISVAKTEVSFMHGRLAVALQKRGVENAKKYTERRIDGDSTDSKRMKKFSEIIGKDLNDFVQHFATVELVPGGTQRQVINVRRKGGHIDRDGVLDEMKGEPYNLYIGSISKAEDNYARSIFHPNRYTKTAKAWEYIDRVADAMEDLAENNMLLRETHLPKLVADIRQYAKDRSELMSYDHEYKPTIDRDSEYRTADDRLCVTRDMLMAFFPPENDIGHRASRSGQDTNRALELIREGTLLIYDMAKVRSHRPVSTREFEGKAQEHIRTHPDPGKRSAVQRQQDGRSENLPAWML